MKKTRYVPWILAVEAVGILSAFLSRDGIELYAQIVRKPALSPPGILFPAVWSVLYALMGVGAARIADVSDNRLRYRCWNIFVVQLVINFFWSLIFFNAQAYGVAFWWVLLLWALVLGMIFLFSSADTLAALLQIPYLLWVTFAGYLTCSVWMGNR